ISTHGQQVPGYCAGLERAPRDQVVVLVGCGVQQDFSRDDRRTAFIPFEVETVDALKFAPGDVAEDFQFAFNNSYEGIATDRVRVPAGEDQLPAVIPQA